MDGNETLREIVERLDSEIDRIDGLIALHAHGGRVEALVESHDRVTGVRDELERSGLPRPILDIYVIGEVLIPYPTDDERLMQRLMQWSNRRKKQE